MDYTKIGQIITKAIVDSTEYILSKGKFDKTFTAVVIKNIESKKYSVRHNGIEYTAKGPEGITEGSFVKVCAPQNDWSDLFIVYRG